MNPTLEDLKNADACKDGYDFYAENDCDPAKLVPEHPEWYLWLVGNCPGDWIDPALLDECVEQYPRTALWYAADLLTPERLDWCAERTPWTALMCAGKHLTPERLDACAAQYPRIALRYAVKHLTLERLKWCEDQP